MYQGTNKTACSSQRQIADAMLALMRDTPFAELTVSAVCQKARVSRATFYSLFQSKENVILYLLMQDCCDAPEQGTGDALRLLCRSYSAYVARQAELLRLLSAHRLLPLMQGILNEFLTGCACFQACIREDLRPYAASYVAAGLTSIAEIYVREASGSSALEDIAYALLSGRLLSSDDIAE